MSYCLRFLMIPLIAAFGVLTATSASACARPVITSSASDGNGPAELLESLLGNSYDGGILNGAAYALIGLENGLSPEEALESDNAGKR